MTAQIITLYPDNHRNPSAMLRKLADEIEAGTYGDVETVAVALMGTRMECFGGGPDCEATEIAMLFNAAVLRITRAIEEHNK